MAIYTVYDIETTGLNVNTCEILEYGYIRVNEKTEIVAYGELYFWKPGWQIDRGAAGVHGLTPEFMRQFTEDFDKNLAALYTLTKDAYICGKNSRAFDDKVVHNFLERHLGSLPTPDPRGIADMQEWLKPSFQEWLLKSQGIDPGRRKGTLEEYMRMMGLSYETLKKMFQEECPKARRDTEHSGLFDAYQTLMCLRYAVEKLNFKL